MRECMSPLLPGKGVPLHRNNLHARTTRGGIFFTVSVFLARVLDREINTTKRNLLPCNKNVTLILTSRLTETGLKLSCVIILTVVFTYTSVCSHFSIGKHENAKALRKVKCDRLKLNRQISPPF